MSLSLVLQHIFEKNQVFEVGFTIREHIDSNRMPKKSSPANHQQGWDLEKISKLRGFYGIICGLLGCYNIFLKKNQVLQGPETTPASPTRRVVWGLRWGKRSEKRVKHERNGPRAL